MGDRVGPGVFPRAPHRAAPIVARALRRGRVTQPAPGGARVAAPGTLPALEAQLRNHKSINSKAALASSYSLGSIVLASLSRKLAFGPRLTRVSLASRFVAKYLLPANSSLTSWRQVLGSSLKWMAPFTRASSALMHAEI